MRFTNLRMICLLGVLPLAIGCSALPAPDPGETLYDGRQLRAVEKVSMKKAWRTSRLALKKLGMKEIDNHLDAMGGRLVFETTGAERGRRAMYVFEPTATRVVLVFHRMEPKLTEVKIKYGFVGSREKSHVLLKEIQAKLHPAPKKSQPKKET